MHHQSRMFDNIGSIAFGAGLMYFLDPVQGRRRRALVRDQCASALRQWSDILDKAARDLGNRTRGMVAEAQAAWSRAPVDDAVLVARVRTKLGRAVSHPSAIEVTAQPMSAAARIPTAPTASSGRST